MLYKLFRSNKYILLIILGFVLGAVIIFLIKEIRGEEEGITTKNLENFIIEEDKNEIHFFDKEHNEILIIDKR
jgi:hypothetical protein